MNEKMTGIFHAGLSYIRQYPKSVSAAVSSEDSQNIQEYIDEVQIELECTVYRKILSDLSVSSACTVIVLLDSLHIPCCYAEEQNNSDIAEQQAAAECGNKYRND